MKASLRSWQASVMKVRQDRLKLKQDKLKASHLNFFFFKENQSQKVEGEKRKPDPTKYL